ncbi:17864_t:CDS:2 [Funneliformis geosporum]|uniref:7964_t:CDS:1 n=1 Tax=Funneliformis geosporum TaxID=1117311 RepID=A0A9W4SHH2_9GLOM|nr:7964_t:CDS:2 [Funneliformis geosporum]CAI2187685.1 17864_t:CDS:2 [Funneliformis geosporum]
MKSSIFIAIIFGLFMLTLIEGYTVVIQNKVTKGTDTMVAATYGDEGGNFNWWHTNDAIVENFAEAHSGYNITIPDNVTTYWLVFGVDWSTEQDKWRGPFTNNGDQCWHFHGTLDDWKIYGC